MEGKIIKINLYAITFIRKQHFKIMNRWHLILFNTIFTLGVCHKNSFPGDKIIYAVIHRNLIILNDKKCNMDKIKTFALRYNLSIMIFKHTRRKLWKLNLYRMLLTQYDRTQLNPTEMISMRLVLQHKYLYI